MTFLTKRFVGKKVNKWRKLFFEGGAGVGFFIDSWFLNKNVFFYFLFGLRMIGVYNFMLIYFCLCTSIRFRFFIFLIALKMLSL